MLQLNVTIIHNEDGTHYIESIYRVKTGSTLTDLLAKFDHTTSKIDLDVLEPFSNTEMTVVHLYREDDAENYAIKAIFNGVEIDPVSGLKMMCYTPIE